MNIGADSELEIIADIEEGLVVELVYLTELLDDDKICPSSELFLAVELNWPYLPLLLRIDDVGISLQDTRIGSIALGGICCINSVFVNFICRLLTICFNSKMSLVYCSSLELNLENEARR